MPLSPYYRNLRASVGTELLLMPAVAAVIRDGADRLLLQRNQAGLWSLPAGAIEPGEAPARAIVREVQEETGLLVRAERVLAVVGGAGCRVTYPNGDRVEYIVTLFACAHVGGAMIESNDETASLHWMTLDEMPALAFPYPERALRAAEAASWFEWNDAWLEQVPELNP